MPLRITEKMISSPTYQDIHNIRKILSKIEHHFWEQHVLFSWQWWFLLFATIVPWIIWWRVADKSRFYEILTFGFFWVVIGTSLDDFGTTLHLWGYPRPLVNLMPPLVPADFSVLPVTYMLLYQYTNRWNVFIFGSIITAIIFSYVIEPFFIQHKMLVFYRSAVIEWSHTKSFISFTCLSILIRFFHLTLLRKIGQQK